MNTTPDPTPEGWRKRHINRGTLGGKCPLPGDQNWAPHDGKAARRRRLKQMAKQELKSLPDIDPGPARVR